MRMKRTAVGIDRYTPIGKVADDLKRVLKMILLPLGVLMAVGTAYLAASNGAGATAFGMIALGSWCALLLWSRLGRGLPLLPVLVAQSLTIYGLPIVLGHEVVAYYGQEFVLQAGREVLIFIGSAAVAWAFGMQLFPVARPVSYSLIDVNRHGIKGLRRLGFGLMLGSIAYQVSQSLDWADAILRILPTGSQSIVTALVYASGACGFFLVAIAVRSSEFSPFLKLAFWALLILSSLIAASGFLLSTVTINLMAVAIGLFWGSGRVPWRYLLLIGVALSVLNIGKFTMRNRYWNFEEGEPENVTTLGEIPGVYTEWIQASYTTITAPRAEKWLGGTNPAKASQESEQSLFDRIDNLQNLLFVIDAVGNGHIPPLGGETYKVIPALLVPRIFWPDKPRSHQGQIMLNVHFGRQDIDSTLKTYVAWGLLPEAYGNFGPIEGALVLGIFLGLIFAWLENMTARKLLISIEGFVSFTILLIFANSSEMVASVFVTAVAQSVAPIIIACSPFVRRLRIERPKPGEIAPDPA